MTQERKDQLYDQMIAWICEHHGDDELFQILCGQFGMTREELHDHCMDNCYDSVLNNHYKQKALSATLDSTY